MNEINELVFQVYEELLNSDYKLNEKKTLSYILRKTFRYIVSGYIFQLRTNKIKMNLMNEFIPSNNKHKKRKTKVRTTKIIKYLKESQRKLRIW